ncbi:hypothetical protein DPMN_126629 [Dreissena polymorpha]|uniref:Uncharacterized protein n=1 Tax=Dreissena polymorpha TaxID=45954 RepID=A0A9D4GW32_DREPO|nr:hypothetical protein DPMN_126629 [Dreissena polymorpha]
MYKCEHLPHMQRTSLQIHPKLIYIKNTLYIYISSLYKENLQFDIKKTFDLIKPNSTLTSEINSKCCGGAGGGVTAAASAASVGAGAGACVDAGSNDDVGAGAYDDGGAGVDDGSCN